MKVFLRQNVANVGRAGEIITVSDGYAMNYLLPHKLGVVVNEHNEAEFSRRISKIEQVKEIKSSKTSSLADRIGSLQVVIKRKLHDDGKLYGSINGQEIAEELSKHGVSIAKNQVIIEKSIKAHGVHTVVIKLSSSLQPTLSVKVVAE